MKKLSLMFVFLIFYLSVRADTLNDIKKYVVSIEPNFSSKSIFGKTKIFFNRATQEKLSFPRYGIQIDKVVSGNKQVNFKTTENQLNIEAISMKEIEIHYHGSPARGLFWGDDYVYSTYDPCAWMICLEDPGMRIPIELHLKFPKNYHSVALGTLSSFKSNKKFRSEIWIEANPYASYLYGFAIGNFKIAAGQFNQVKLNFLAINDNEKSILEKFKETTELAMSFFEKRSGVPFPLKSYSQVLVKNSEAQEKQGFSILGHSFVDPILKNPQEDWAIVHELAHQWWGNNITCKSWDHFWLNEGLVVFMTAAFKQERWGQAAYDREMDLARKRYQNAIDAKFDVPLTFSGEYPSLGIKRSIVYSKGALFIDALRKEIGDEVFWKGLEKYTVKNQMRSVVSKDFQSAMESASQKDLNTIFKKWVY
jgi:aminopeptidase N